MATRKAKSQMSQRDREQLEEARRINMAPRTFQWALDQAAQHAQIGAKVSTEDPSTAVVQDNKGEWRMYKATAWQRPAHAGLLAWSPPPFAEDRIVAIVKPDGSWEKGPAFTNPSLPPGTRKG
jgi:hypothetical protein